MWHGLHVILFYLCFQSSDGSGGETVPQSVSSSFVGSVAAAGGQRVEQVVARVEWLSDNVCGESWQCDPESIALSCDLLSAAVRAPSVLRCDAFHRRTPESSLPVLMSVTSSQSWEISFSLSWFTYYLRLLYVSPPHFLTGFIYRLCRLSAVCLCSDHLYGPLPLGPMSMIRQQAICHCHCN